MPRRDLSTFSILLLLLALVGGLAWLSRHPDAEILARAEGWPAVGRLAAAFRRAYLPPPAPSTTDRGRPEGGAAAGRGERAEPGPLPAAERTEPEGEAPSATVAPSYLWLAPGDRLLARPEAGADQVAEAEAFTRALRFESRGDWHRVSLEGREGWVLRPPGAHGAPPLPATVEPVKPVPGRPPDPERLAAVEKLLGVAEPAGRLGPYPLYTAGADPGLLWFLDRLAAAVEPAYRRRYGRRPVGEPTEVAALFPDEATYRAFQALDQRLRDLPAAGHAGFGLIALYSGGRRRDEVAATLVHEIAHLLNRRGLGPALPPWLDEGIASDLAASAIGPAGELDAERLGGAIERSEGRIDYYGAQASVRRLAGALADGAVPPLPELFARDWEGFVRSDRLELHYAAAGFFWRYLLEGEQGALAASARAFLAEVAAGGPVDADALQGRLGRTWADLEDGFEQWVADEAGDVDDPRAWLHS